MKKHLVRIALGLLVVLAFLGHAAALLSTSLSSTVWRPSSTTPACGSPCRARIDPRIVIVDIDEKSLEEEGRWPWRRDRLGLLLDRLFDQYKAKVVGFDVVFAERDESSGPAGARRTRRRTSCKGNARLPGGLEGASTPKLEFDRIFAEKMRGRPVVLGYYFTRSRETEPTGRACCPTPVLPKGVFAGAMSRSTYWTGYGANLPELQQAAASAGHFNPLPDDDGVTRRVPMLAEYEGAYYEPLSLAVVRLMLGSPPGHARVHRRAVVGQRLSRPGVARRGRATAYRSTAT